jgi:hypothetical protein
MMKRLAAILAFVATICVVTYGQTNVNNTQLNSNPSQVQNTTAIGGGSSNATSNSDSTAYASGGSSNSTSVASGGEGGEGGIAWSSLEYSPTSISNYKTRTPPLGAYPPYLPAWNHGGWGTISAYFPNGPTNAQDVYERTFDTANEDDMRELKGMLGSLSYSGPLELIGGMFNGLVRLFGGPDRFHHGRGIEISNGVYRDRRPEGKPMFVFIDSNIDARLLEEAGYAYVGRLSLEGKTKRNWDQVYNAAIAEALPWDVDILLVSGGMKGVTVGSNTSFPTAAGAFSQASYSLSLLGGYGKGITEGKGEAMISAAAYRYCPQMLERRSIPAALYERIRVRPKADAAAAAAAATSAPADLATETADDSSTPVGASARTKKAVAQRKTTVTGVDVSRELYNRAGLPAAPVETTMMR